jgi:hypothetical protein
MLNNDYKNKHIYSTRKGFEECVREETGHLATLTYKMIAFLKTLQRLKQERQKSPDLSPVLVVLNKKVKTFWKKSNLKCGLIRTRKLR